MGDNFKSVDSRAHREEIIGSQEHAIVLATSGMLNGGTSVEYFKNFAPDEKNAICFVGYQANGTLGRKVKDGDIIYSTVRPNQKHFGIIKSQPTNFLVSTGFTTIRAKLNKADSEFIYWYLSQPAIIEFLQGLGETSTSAYPSIKPSDIEALELLSPPVKEQKSIASILGALDYKIKNNSEMNETLEDMAHSIFKSWFVDYDPVYTKATGKIPDHMDSKTFDLFPNSFGSTS